MSQKVGLFSIETDLIYVDKSNYELKVSFILVLLMVAMIPMLSYSETVEELKSKAHTIKKRSNTEIQVKMRERLEHSKTFNASSGFDKRMKSRAYSAVSSAAKKNSSSAQFALASMYYQGIRVKKDYKKAVELYKNAASRGHTKAQFNLAYMYFDGRGTQKNHDEALKWFLKAGEHKDGKAELYLGLIYKEKNDYQKAFHWYSEAAKEGYPKAQYELAKMYYSGKVCKKDLKKYIYYLKKAAMQNEAHAEFDLGIAYLKGKGVEKDTKKAYHWLQKAHLDGSNKAKKVLHKLRQIGLQ